MSSPGLVSSATKKIRASALRLSIGMLQIVGSEPVVPHTKNRPFSLFPACDLHCIFPQSPSHQSDRKNQPIKKYGQNDFRHDRPQGGAECKPEPGERLENRWIGHGHNQKSDRQQHEYRPLPDQETNKTDQDQGQAGILVVFNRQFPGFSVHRKWPLWS